MDSILHHVIQTLGYPGIMILMALESACIPIPSELIMPFGGLGCAPHGPYNVWIMGVVGTLGELCGSTAAYFVGKSGGRRLIERYGKYILIRHKDLDKADVWFKKHGEAAVLFGRWMPVVRTFISFPAGVARMQYGRFIIYTIIGSLPWCVGLAWTGNALGKQLKTVLVYLDGVKIAVIVVLAALMALYVWHHVRGGKDVDTESSSA